MTLLERSVIALLVVFQLCSSGSYMFRNGFYSSWMIPLRSLTHIWLCHLSIIISLHCWSSMVEIWCKTDHVIFLVLFNLIDHVIHRNIMYLNMTPTTFNFCSNLVIVFHTIIFWVVPWFCHLCRTIDVHYFTIPCGICVIYRCYILCILYSIFYSSWIIHTVIYGYWFISFTPASILTSI